ncbi:MAG TPA: biotin/lipoyl-containing protein [Bryobacteraceae bacterium]|nr:biotin/lipoyl-containing protein [Bryobacteraceae bacterium]
MKWQILVDGRPVEIDPERLEAVTEVEPGVYSVMVGGVSYEVRLLAAPQGLSAETADGRFNVEVSDPRDARRGSAAALGSGRQNVVAPMPGKVIRVLARKGDIVAAGQGLVVVEAMKMQNELKASRPGEVVDVRVQAGATVSAGDTLVVLG